MSSAVPPSIPPHDVTPLPPPLSPPAIVPSQPLAPQPAKPATNGRASSVPPPNGTPNVSAIPPRANSWRDQPPAVPPANGAGAKPVVRGAAAVPLSPKPAPRVRPLQETEEEPKSQKFDPLREAPAWLVSLVIHLFLLVLLALLSTTISTGVMTLEVSFGETAVETSQELMTFDLAEADQMVAESLASEAADEKPLDASEILKSNIPDLVRSMDAIPEPEVPITPNAMPSGGITSGRTGPTKDLLLKIYGGTQATQDAVELGLEWLARQQQKDGSWSLRGPYHDGGMVRENLTAATSMAMLAFLGNGNTHQSGKYQRQMEKAINWLMKQQDREGNMVRSAQSDQKMYSHGQATIVLCELFGMTGDSKLRPYAQLAIDYAVDAQSPEGGWRYNPRQDSDMSVTGWFVMALVSGKSANLEIPGTVFENVWRFLNTVQYDDGATYAYLPNQAPSDAMTAEGLLSRMYMGWPGDHPSLKLGVEALTDQSMFDKNEKNFYYWYYATQVMHHYGSEPWRKWNNKMKVELPALQIKAGPEIGSWAPQGSAWGEPIGRLYTTCMAIYCLEVYYRHLPLYNNPWDKK